MDENDATLEDVPVQAEIPSNDKPSEEIDADGGDLLGYYPEIRDLFGFYLSIVLYLLIVELV